MEEEFQDYDRRNAWNFVYQRIRSESAKFLFSCKDAKKPENKLLNRYRDVYPFDHSRIHLKKCEQDYINASLVEVPKAERSYILTQGPLNTTTEHFWLMVWEQESAAIIMLNRLIEKNTVKCHQYWPIGQANGGEDQYVFKDVDLAVVYESEESASNYTLRKFTLLDLQTRESRSILQFHYTTWPDFGVPESPAAFLNFLFAVRDAGVLENMGPAIVHCSAGIGRSGTFCLVDSCLVLIEKSGDPNSVNIRDVLVAMRGYRMGLIQTADQLRFSYLAIIEGSKSILNKEKEILVPSEKKEDVLHSLGKSSDETDEISEEILSQSDSSDEGIANSNTCTSTSDSPPPVPPRPVRSYDNSTSTSPSSLLPDNSPKMSPENSISLLLYENKLVVVAQEDSSLVENYKSGETSGLDQLVSENTKNQSVVATKSTKNTKPVDYEADMKESGLLINEDKSELQKFELFERGTILCSEDSEMMDASSSLADQNAKNSSEVVTAMEKSVIGCSSVIDNSQSKTATELVHTVDEKADPRSEATSSESLSELRKRQRLERSEKTAAMVQQIKKKQKETEIWQKRRLRKERRSSNWKWGK